MPWNGSGTANVTDGTFTGRAIWTQEKNAAQLVTAAHFDSFSNDICGMFGNCYTLDGQTIGNVLALVATTTSSLGVLNIGGSPFLSNMSGTFGGNTFIANAGNFSLTGSGNIGIGYGPLSAPVGTLAMSLLTSGNSNIGIGAGTLAALQTGSSNVAVGAGALTAVTASTNVGFGHNAGNAVTSGANNTFLGDSTGSQITTGGRNIVVGAGCDLVGPTVSGQVNIACTIWGTGCTGTGTTAGTGKIGINNNAPTYTLDVSGDFGIGAAGKGLRVKEGSNAKQGVATLSGGTVVVSNTSVTASSRIILTAQDNSSTGALRVSARSAGTSFTITSSNGADSGVIAYQIFEPY